MRRFLLLIFCLAAMPGHAAPRTPGAADFRHGYFCAIEPVGKEAAEGTISGEVLLVEGLPPFIAPGPLVPAQIGVGFGVHVRVNPQMAGPVTIHVEHPPITGISHESWTTFFTGDDMQYVGFAFEHDYELVQGRWSMWAEAAGREIYAVDFQVVDPALLPTVICGQHTPLS
jgi:hypothetical protein